MLVSVEIPVLLCRAVKYLLSVALHLYPISSRGSSLLLCGDLNSNSQGILWQVSQNHQGWERPLRPSSPIIT